MMWFARAAMSGALPVSFPLSASWLMLYPPAALDTNARTESGRDSNPLPVPPLPASCTLCISLGLGESCPQGPHGAHSSRDFVPSHSLSQGRLQPSGSCARGSEQVEMGREGLPLASPTQPGNIDGPRLWPLLGLSKLVQWEKPRWASGGLRTENGPSSGSAPLQPARPGQRCRLNTGDPTGTSERRWPPSNYEAPWRSLWDLRGDVSMRHPSSVLRYLLLLNP